MKDICKQLNIPQSYIDNLSIKKYDEADKKDLINIGIDFQNRAIILFKDCSDSWVKMVNDAKLVNVDLIFVSGFRSVKYQFNLIQNRLNNNENILEILKSNALPGFSEHHTGRAIDITTTINGQIIKPYLSVNFENTEAFAWMKKNASKYNFSLSFPRGNKQGFIYEPWHWCWNK